ncbi:hypothetical protein HDU98_003708 [Podochytrium sp. JEL0797]|nr:hypothetical protein HDU98_003708 [Podochytrium sp. JEL0797]
MNFLLSNVDNIAPLNRKDSAITVRDEKEDIKQPENATPSCEPALDKPTLSSKLSQTTTKCLQSIQSFREKVTTSARKYWSFKSCRICCYTIVATLTCLTLFIPLFIKFALPSILSSAFASSNFASGQPMVVSLFQINALSNHATPQNSNTTVAGGVGSANISINVSQSGFAGIIPFGIPVVFEPMEWIVSLGVVAMTAANASAEAYVQQVETFYEMAVVNVPGVSYLSSTGVFSLNAEYATVQVLNPPSFAELKMQLTNGNPQVFPLGARFVDGFLKCLMSGSVGDVPRIKVSATVDVWVGGLLLNGVVLERIVDMGAEMVKNNLPFPSITPTTASDPTKSFQVSLSNLNLNLSGPGSTTLTVAFPTATYPVNPLTYYLTSLHLRVNVTNVPAYTLTAPLFSATQGSANISTKVLMTPLQTETTLVSSFLLQKEIKVGVDMVDVRDAVGGKVGWVSDLMGAVWVQIPGNVFGGGSGLQALGVGALR